MLIEFRAADRVLGFKALGIYEKGIESAKGACEKVYVSSLPLQTAEQETADARAWLGRIDEMEPGETHDLDIPVRLALTIRTACSVYMAQLSKLAEKEVDMLVPLDNTKDIMSQLQSFADRLGGQIEMGSVVGQAMADAIRHSSPEAGDDLTATISVNGGPAIPMDQFERGVRSMSKRV